MKLDPLFKSENNKLYTLDGIEVAVAGCPVLSAEQCAVQKNGVAGCGVEKVCAVTLPWSLVGTEEGGYNEELLAALRDWLKVLEEKELFAFMVPVADKPVGVAEKAEFTASMKHCARRIKDCVSVVGFAIPEEVDADLFVAELSEKHAQYVFFSRDEKQLGDKKIVF